MKEKGFTLIELMIAISIFSVFSIFLYNMFSVQVKESFNFKDNINTQYNLNKAMTMITASLRENSYKDSFDYESLDSLGLIYNKNTKTLSDKYGRKSTGIDEVTIKNDLNEAGVLQVTVSSYGFTSDTAINVDK
ncbi:prepilin-type N-terminal cleavage/methylation domain-containing protein [Clostridium sp. cel8]|uniref:PulJ/GspJ family protein n=1 Tax=Clostridium sp. cel8 TaxID=2663123 RepID=UPI0015F6CCBB|nr:prepilin-type N-terminal cleavage/methylation domain-containing protein [Clostridium sp. cel8]MBA5849989.1 prepilin-type N-terminal cleavage/methylation domain-containing protein [Clostridium sp. cel8]